MESEHHTLNNPWSFQQPHDLDSEEEPTHPLSRGLRSRRDPDDRRHYSYASSITLAPDLDDNDDIHPSESSFYYSQKHATDPDSTTKRSASPVVLSRSWSSESALTDLATENHTISYQDTTTRRNDSPPLDPPPPIPTDPTPAAAAAASAHASGSNDLSEKTLSNGGGGALESDGLEDVVQRLQTEVADTRAVVFDLETRLCVAETSNKHIVDELKILLADAEGTLVGSDESDSGESVAVSSKHGSVSEEDSNIVYNRICDALESLITEAQTALDRSTNNPSPSPQPVERRPSSRPRRLRTSQGQRQRLLQLPNASTIDLSSTPTDDGESSQVAASRRSSITPTRTDRSLSVSSAATSLASSSRPQVPSRRSTYSKMMWREKQLEQYERFKRSSDRISLELKMLLDDTIMDQLELQEAYNSSASPSSPPRTHSSSPSTSSSRARPSDVPPSPSRQSSENVGTSSHSGRRRGTGSKVERMQRSYQLQMLNPQVRPRQQLHRRRPGSSQDFSSSMYSHHHSSSQSSSAQRYSSSSSSSSRQFRSLGVGASHPQSIILQLYRLWKQTWLRKRIMHVLTESLEVMLILWVIMKLSEASLAWMGIQMSKGGPRAWLAYIYGDREGAGAAAKELYEKIRRDGLRLQQYQFRQQQERETLMQEFSASEAASGIPGTPFSPKGMVLAPARRLLEHAVSGVVLAYLSDAARRLARTL